MLSVQEIIRSVIYAQHGWAIADQFDSVYEDRSKRNMCELNFAALEYMLETVRDMVRSSAFSEEVVEDLIELKDAISAFLDEVPNMKNENY